MTINKRRYKKGPAQRGRLLVQRKRREELRKMRVERLRQGGVGGERDKAMSSHPDKIAEHYRELAAEEVTLAKAAVTNEARPNITRWRLSIGASRRPQKMKSSNDHQILTRTADDSATCAFWA
jgi:hypothetical protein